MFFASDNCGPVHPAVMDAVAAANDGYAMPYGNDTLMERVRDEIRAQFDAPSAAVYLVATGTAANALSLACLTDPYDTVFCTPVAHIHADECNAPEFFTGGAKLTLVDAPDGKMSVQALRSTLAATNKNDVHWPQPGAVSLTNVTEMGTVYTSAEIAALTEVAGEHGLPVHMDGARLANALAATGNSPADMTWKAGVDVVSLGGTKNGCMGVEAVILFDPAKAWEFELRRKRGAHLFSKHRYLSAQMAAYLHDGLWLDLARRANRATSRLVEGLRHVPGTLFLHPPDANIVFASWARSGHGALVGAGAQYYMDEAMLTGADDEIIPTRLVCDWSVQDADVDRFVGILKTELG